MVAVTYVRDIAAAREFYRLLGFTERSSGTAETSAWSSLHHGDHSLVLASTQPRLELPPIPLLFYFYVEDVEAAAAVCVEAGITVTRSGHPPHAQGGEFKLIDPDGNTILVGQRERSAEQPVVEDTSPHFSLLKEAAAAVAARGGAGTPCQVRNIDRSTCPNAADVKLADPAGATVWTCLTHAEEMLVALPGVFIANQELRSIEEFLQRRGA
jgi:predicted enzyme related to lactoylglutathione lyase